MVSNGEVGICSFKNSQQKLAECPLCAMLALSPSFSGNCPSKETIAHSHEQVLNSYDFKGKKCGFTLKFSNGIKF